MKIVTSAIVALAMTAPGAALAGGIANAQGWTGFYVGGHVGGLRADYEGFYDADGTDGTGDFTSRFGDLDEWGFGGGGQIGYDYQAPGMHGVVVGVVVDGTYTSNDSSSTDCCDDVISAGVNWLGSVRLRAGYPVADIMPYVTVGAAYADIDATIMDDGDAAMQIGDEEWGYVAGFGMDWAVTPHVTIGAEALMYDFDYFVDIGATGYPDADSGDFFQLDRMFNFRLTANYRF